MCKSQHNFPLDDFLFEEVRGIGSLRFGQINQPILDRAVHLALKAFAVPGAQAYHSGHPIRELKSCYTIGDI